MGHTTTNSGAFRQRFAALRDWGLIEGSGGTVRLSDLGRELAYQTDAPARKAALRQAFGECALFGLVYDEAVKDTPIDPSKIGSRAVLSHGVAPESRGSFVRSFVDSAIAAGLAGRVDDTQIRLLDPEAEAENVELEGDGPTLVPDIAFGTARGPIRHPSAAPSVLHHPWPIKNGEIVLEVRSTRPLPARAFGALAEIVERLEHLARELSDPPDEQSRPE